MQNVVKAESVQGAHPGMERARQQQPSKPEGRAGKMNERRVTGCCWHLLPCDLMEVVDVKRSRMAPSGWTLRGCQRLLMCRVAFQELSPHAVRTLLGPVTEGDVRGVSGGAETWGRGGSAVVFLRTTSRWDLRLRFLHATGKPLTAALGRTEYDTRAESQTICCCL